MSLPLRPQPFNYILPCNIACIANEKQERFVVVKVAKKAKKSSKISRKELKQDDQFIEVTGKGVEVAGEYRNQIIVVVIGIFLLTAGIYLFRAQQTHRANALTEDIGKALKIYNGQIDKEKKSTDDVKYFATAKAKHEASVKAFTKLLKKHKGSTGANLVHLYLGHSYFGQKKYKKAREEYMNFLARVKEKDPMAFLGVEALARVQQALNNAKLGLSKLQSYKEQGAQKIKPFALMRLAEYYQRKKDYKQARVYYKQLSKSKDAPSKMKDTAERRLAVLP